MEGGRLDRLQDRVLEPVDAFLDEFKRGEEDHVDNTGADHGDAETWSGLMG